MTGSAKTPRLLLGLLCLYALTLALYFVARPAGRWVETDTNTLTQAIGAMQAEKTLLPQAATYPHGFLFQAASAFLAQLSGVSPGILQRLIYPFISVLALLLTAQFFYTQASGERRLAALAVLLLCFQPDVLFVILRGSHEKLDWPLMMTSLALLYRSLGQPTRRLAVYLALFYLLLFAQIATNVYFASTFLFAISISLLLGAFYSLVLRRRKLAPGEGPGRLLYITLSGSILFYVFIHYIYPPALTDMRLLGDIFARLRALLLGLESASQPYAYISFGWINPGVYLSLSAFTWLLIAGSLAEWCQRGWRILSGQEPPGLKHNLDWLLYAGFALQVGISIVVDFSGALSSNLQLRVFPGFTVLACLLLAKGLRRAAGWSTRTGRRAAAGSLLAVLCAWFAIAAVLKAANEPLLSNKWSFYQQDELAALDWSLTHLENTEIWTGIDERLRDAYTINYGFNIPGGNRLGAYRFQGSYKYVLLSAREELRAERTGFTLPAVFDWLRIYDNGVVRLYHARPVTPFQR